MIITITGTPGVGKTYIAKKLAGKNLIYIDLNKVIREEKLYDKYDRNAKTYDVDIKILKKLEKAYDEFKDDKPIKDKKDNNNRIQNIKESTLTKLKDKLKNKKGLIIDSHLSQYIDSDLCVVVKADIKKINARLKKRDYGKQKIRDNVESEIFDICLEEAKNLGRDIIILNN
jgi:adenylate kinase